MSESALRLVKLFLNRNSACPFIQNLLRRCWQAISEVFHSGGISNGIQIPPEWFLESPGRNTAWNKTEQDRCLLMLPKLSIRTNNITLSQLLWQEIASGSWFTQQIYLGLKEALICTLIFSKFSGRGLGVQPLGAEANLCKLANLCELGPALYVDIFNPMLSIPPLQVLEHQHPCHPKLSFPYGPGLD